MDFGGFGHVTLTVSKYDECLPFYVRLMTHLGMRKYIDTPLAAGWFADEYMFVIGRAASRITANFRKMRLFPRNQRRMFHVKHF